MSDNDETQEMVIDRHESRAIGNVTVHASSIRGKRETQDDSFAFDEGAHTDPEKIRTGMREAIADSVAQSDYIGNGGYSTTLTSLYVTPDKRVICGNIGDSPAYIVIRDKTTNEISIQQISYTHNLSNVEERQKRDPDDPSRLKFADTLAQLAEKAKSKPKGWYEAKLAASLTAGIHGGTKMRDVVTNEINIAPFLADPNKEVSVLLTSDGVKPELVISDAFKTFLKGKLANPSANIAQDITQYMLEHGSADNITALLATIPSNIEKPIMLTVGDGVGESYVLSNYATNSALEQLGASKYVEPSRLAGIPDKSEWKAEYGKMGGRKCATYQFECKDTSQCSQILAELKSFGVNAEKSEEGNIVQVSRDDWSAAKMSRVFSIKSPGYHEKEIQRWDEEEGLDSGGVGKSALLAAIMGTEKKETAVGQDRGNNLDTGDKKQMPEALKQLLMERLKGLPGFSEPAPESESPTAEQANARRSKPAARMRTQSQADNKSKRER